MLADFDKFCTSATKRNVAKCNYLLRIWLLFSQRLTNDVMQTSLFADDVMDVWSACDMVCNGTLWSDVIVLGVLALKADTLNINLINLWWECYVKMLLCKNFRARAKSVVFWFCTVVCFHNARWSETFWYYETHNLFLVNFVCKNYRNRSRCAKCCCKKFTATFL